MEDIRLEVDNYREILLPVPLKDGETLQYHGGDKAILYAKNWQTRGEIEVDALALTVSQGAHTILFDGTIIGGDEAEVKMEIRLVGPAERVIAKY